MTIASLAEHVALANVEQRIVVEVHGFRNFRVVESGAPHFAAKNLLKSRLLFDAGTVVSGPRLSAMIVIGRYG
jgi:hypothetical protein